MTHTLLPSATDTRGTPASNVMIALGWNFIATPNGFDKRDYKDANASEAHWLAQQLQRGTRQKKAEVAA